MAGIGQTSPRLRWRLIAAVTVALAALAASRTAASAPPPDALDRVQLHGNPSRGMAYRSLPRASARNGHFRLAARVIRTIALDGDPLQNVYASLLPIDVGEDGQFGFVHFNGTRFMQVWSAAGRKLWRIENPDGYLHDMRDAIRRDTAAILDLDGDGRQDIVHCWSVAGRKNLVFRRGVDGAVIRRVPLDNGNLECGIAAFHVVGRETPLLLVAGTSAARHACAHDWVGYWAHTQAYGVGGRLLWARDTCEAGHHAWPVDRDQDGRAEAIFVGKYLLRPDGELACTLDGWPRNDHVDSMTVADFEPGRPGLEAVAAGRRGIAMFDATDCRALWRISTRVIRNPQRVAAARLDAASTTPLIAVEERGSEHRSRTFVVDGRGRLKAYTGARFMPIQNADLDGANGVDELVGSFGQVMGRFGWRRLTRDWYWDLHGDKVRETSGGPYPALYDRWQAFPLVFDYDRDGTDEIVTWGQSLIVVGKIGD